MNFDKSIIISINARAKKSFVQTTHAVTSMNRSHVHIFWNGKYAVSSTPRNTKVLEALTRYSSKYKYAETIIYINGRQNSGRIRCQPHSIPTGAKISILRLYSRRVPSYAPINWNLTRYLAFDSITHDSVKFHATSRAQKHFSQSENLSSRRRCVSTKFSFNLGFLSSKVFCWQKLECILFSEWKDVSKIWFFNRNQWF